MIDAIFGLAAVLLLVLLNGFFVAAEFGLVGARRTRIAQLASEGHGGAKAAEKALEHLDNFIAATQLGITLASLGLGWIGEPAIADLLEPFLENFLPETIAVGVGHSISVAIAFSVVTMLHIILGELAPKSIALQRPEETSIIVARPTTLFLRVFRPLIYVMNAIGNRVVRLIGFEPVSEQDHAHSVEELRMLVQSSGEAGIIAAGEQVLFHRAFSFSDISADAIMQPRVEVEAFPLDIALADLLSASQARHFSRYPIYAGTIDNVIGILHTKKLFDFLVENSELPAEDGHQLDLRALVTPPLFVPEKLPIDTLLERMRRAMTHMAIVIGEYGGLVGIVTMEDVLEELVGEVQDEFDADEHAPVARVGDSVMVDGLVTVADCVERFGDPGARALSVTLGGYIAERLGHIPRVGDRTRFGDYYVTVAEMDGMRVARARFSKSAAPDD